MSSYNGENTIEKQILSILNQNNVDVHITVRDDGSKDRTCERIENLAKIHSGKITLVKGENCGWKKSFFKLIGLAKEADYYGFSDQDDYWLPDKLWNSICVMEQDGAAGIKLAHVNSLCTNEHMETQKEQQKRYAQPKNRKAVIAQEYFQGCSMLWNREAMKALQHYTPKADLAHDFWVGTLCFYLGKVYYFPTPQFYHIRYGNNSSADGNVAAGRKKRIRMLFSQNTVYMNPADDLLEGYGNLLQKKDVAFLSDVRDAKRSLIKRVKLVCMPDFRRESFKSTIFFKMLLLMGKY